jgi:flagellar biosynthesis/type III secretory pathway chaperone
MELKKLIGAVADHTVFLDELLAVLEQETAELSNVKIAAMTQTNVAKEELFRKISGHSSILQQKIAALAARQELSSEVSLGAIAEHFAKKGHGELLEKLSRLKKAADGIKQVATMNREIAERFASTISTSLNLVTRIINQSNVYGASGGFQQRPTGAVMINKEA